MNWIETKDPLKRVIGDALRTQASVIGDDVYLMRDDTRLTFSQVNEMVNSYAHGLEALGVRQGDTVSIFMGNSLEFVFAGLALNKLGATFVPTNTAYKGEWLRNTLVDGKAELLLADRQLFDRVSALGGDVPVKRAAVLGLADEQRAGSIDCIPFEVIDSGKLDEPAAEVDYRALASVMWTSGTTGRSKGVMQSHACWLANAAILSQSRGVREGDAFYCCLPLFNSGGWSLNVFSALVSGLPIGIDTAFSVSDFWDRTRLYNATHIFTLGAMHMFLWQAPPKPDDADNPVRVGCCVPIPNDVAPLFRERFGIETTWSGFGQSEMMGWTLCDTTRTDWKPGSCGVARSDIEIKLFDEHDREVPAGEVGEVCVRPREPEVMFQGYFGRPEATLEVFRNLWYHSGDLGRFDEDGELFFVDRKKDMMRYGGRNIASLDVENSVVDHPAVYEVAAHGVPAEELEHEDEVKICVVLKPGATATPEDLARYINDNAPYYMVPRYIEFMDELPHTPTGRVQKFVLRERGVTTETWDRVKAGFKVVR